MGNRGRGGCHPLQARKSVGRGHSTRKGTDRNWRKKRTKAYVGVTSSASSVVSRRGDVARDSWCRAEIDLGLSCITPLPQRIFPVPSTTSHLDSHPSRR